MAPSHPFRRFSGPWLCNLIESRATSGRRGSGGKHEFFSPNTTEGFREVKESLQAALWLGGLEANTDGLHYNLLVKHYKQHRHSLYKMPKWFFNRRLPSMNIHTFLLRRILSACVNPVISFCSSIILPSLLNTDFSSKNRKMPTPAILVQWLS